MIVLIGILIDNTDGLNIKTNVIIIHLLKLGKKTYI